MKTLLALLILCGAAWAQDKPRDGDAPRPERPREGARPGQPGPRDGDRPPAPREGGRRPVPPFNPDEVREWLQANEPQTFARLAELQSSNRREDVARILENASVRMRELNDLKTRDPKGYERVQELRRLEREGVELAEQARRAAPDQKDEVTKKLQENLGKQFDLREEQRVREIAELKRRVESLEKSLGERKAGKEKIVEKRRRELMGEKVDEEW
ncbi:MAG: hypothetical protein JO332_20525 [Planctomycetaceae bacterium]|nr:hypothetical protein [Planctomycetaceae bacterium]